MEKVLYRALTRDDVASFRTLRRTALKLHPEAFAESVEEFDRKTEDDIMASISETQSPSHQFVLGAFDGERLIGIVGLYQQSREKLRHMATVWTVYVDPEYRGRQIGSELMRRLIARARDIEEIDLLELGVAESSTAARQLYESLGFVVSGLEEGAMKLGDRYVNMYFMRKWLRPKP